MHTGGRWKACIGEPFVAAKGFNVDVTSKDLSIKRVFGGIFTSIFPILQQMAKRKPENIPVILTMMRKEDIENEKEATYYCAGYRYSDRFHRRKHFTD